MKLDKNEILAKIKEWLSMSLSEYHTLLDKEDGNTEFGCLLNIIYLVLHLLS